MGGKTQQRVAGDVKPSSSGRTRELLINKHGAGNIITFSTLLSTNKPVVLAQKPKNDPIVPNYKIRPDRRRCIPMPSEIFTDSANVSETKSTPHNVNLKEKELIDSLVDDSQEVETELKKEETVLDFDTILQQLEDIKISCDSQKSETLLDFDEEKLEKECQLLELLETLIISFPKELSIEEWDLIVCSIYKWVSLISNSGRISKIPNATGFCVKVFRLIYQLIFSAKEWISSKEEENENPMIQSLLDDWGNFHSSVLYEDLLVLFLRLFAINDPDKNDLVLIESIASIVIEVNPKSVASNKNLLNYVKAKLELDSDFKYPENSIFCTLDEKKFEGFVAVCGLLRSNYRAIIITAHAILKNNIREICENAGVDSIDVETDPDDIIIIPPQVLMSILTSRDYIMSALLSDFHAGDISVAIDPESDSYSCALTYLLVWDLVIEFIVNVDKQVGHRIIHGLKTLGLIQNLLDNIFMLLPPPSEKDLLTLKFSEKRSDIHKNSYSQGWSLSSFLKSPLRTPLERPMNELELIALHLYFSVASHMPVTVRKWYNNNSNKKLCNIVNEYTVQHISRIICSREMESVQEKCKERANEDSMTNLVIKSRPTANEVYAVYTRDEFRMELTIRLPINYPLGSVQIDGGKRVGVTDLKWRSWLLQLTTFLSHQNGPLLDGIDLWRRNIDKRFEGVEKCMICFSILHSNYQLPKKKCVTCSKMFHNLCLYKWFKTSGNSKCPLCRNIWELYTVI